MATQSSTITMIQQQPPLKTATVVATVAAAPKTADKEDPPVLNHSNAGKTTFFLLDAVGLSAPPLALPPILLLLWHYRQVPVWDTFFSLAFPLYLCLANRFRFDTNARADALRIQRGEPFAGPWEFFEENKEPWFFVYMRSAAVLGVGLPLLLQVLAPLPVADAAAPHLYLLLFQIGMEKMLSGPRFHGLLVAMNPIGFSIYRTVCLKTWLVLAWDMMVVSRTTDSDVRTAVVIFYMAHFVLALSNTVFWTYNLCVLLLLRMLPQCLDQDKFPDADVSWNSYYHLVPVVERHSDKGDKRN